MTEPFVLQPGEGRTLQLADTTLSVKATGDSTNGAYSLIEGVWQPGGFGPLPHRHIRFEESFYVIEGSFDFRIDDSRVRLEAGSFLHVPRGILHGFVNNGDTPARLFFVHAPPLEGFFIELAELTASGRPDPREHASLMEKWGMEVVLPKT
jgi:mannose-6-phosphate isomerase-like protein (cupin superfamily)